MKISKLKRTEMKNTDLSDNIHYSAVLDGTKLIQYSTDGIFHKHLTMKEWIKYIKKNVL
tara:strand:+ start:302 stop:478 length:177 start_codon:yes stop_codon:yes gene_type:complete